MVHIAVSRFAHRSPRVGRVAAAVSAVLALSGIGALAQPVTAAADEPRASASHSSVTVRKGDRGPAVRKIQRRLGISADGVFGPLTHRAVRRFQRRRGLVVDGIVGSATRRALRLRPFSQGSVRHPRSSPDDGGSPSGGGESDVDLPPVLERIAECESGGDPTAVSPGGRYRGKFQFLRSTWEQWGGRGDDPAEASEAHQDRVALRLYRAEGTDPWPACGEQAESSGRRR